MNYTGHIHVLCGPPGAGKTSLLKKINQGPAPPTQRRRLTTRESRREEGGSGHRSLEYEFLKPVEFAERLSSALHESRAADLAELARASAVVCRLTNAVRAVGLRRSLARGRSQAPSFGAQSIPPTPGSSHWILTSGEPLIHAAGSTHADKRGFGPSAGM